MKTNGLCAMNSSACTTRKCVGVRVVHVNHLSLFTLSGSSFSCMLSHVCMSARLAVDARKRSEVNRFHMSPVLEKERLEKKFKAYHHVEVHHNQEVPHTTS